MTPTQLRAFAAVVRLGSVKAAAAELRVTEAAVSLHVGQLRKELGDQLFTRTSAGLAFTPGGLRLASRAVELLGLQDRTVLEVRAAGEGRRLLRLGTSTLFAEYAAPGLIGLFAERAKDLDVELSTHRTTFFESLLMTRTVDATIGPRIARPENTVSSKLFLNYQVVAVTSPDHPLLRTAPSMLLLSRPRCWSMPARWIRARCGCWVSGSWPTWTRTAPARTSSGCSRRTGRSTWIGCLIPPACWAGG